MGDIRVEEERSTNEGDSCRWNHAWGWNHVMGVDHVTGNRIM